jgi:hypothetical protein
MSAFHLVPADQASPQALGILVPPGRRTIVIVRPRGLPWDLVVVRSDRRTGPTATFRDFGRDEAAAAAEGLYSALRRWASGEAPGAIEPALGESGFVVRASIDAFPLVVCRRQPGQPYQPLVTTEPDEAQRTATALMTVLHPAPDANQEVYFNDRQFSRSETPQFRPST